MKKSLKKVSVITGNIILLILLSLNLGQLYQLRRSAQDLLDQTLLSNNPDQLLANIAKTAPLWLWIVNIVAAVIALFLVAGWLVPRLRQRLWFWRANVIWLWFWIIYLLLGVIALIILFNSLF